MSSTWDMLVNAFTNMVIEIINYLPKIIAAIIIVLIGYMIGYLVKKGTKALVDKLLSGVIKRTRIGRSMIESGVDLGSLVGNVLLALIIALSVLVSVTILGFTGYVGSLIVLAAQIIFKIVAGLSIIVIGIPVILVLSEYIAMFFSKMFREKHDLMTELIYDVSVLVLSIFILSVAIDVMFNYSLLLNYLITSAPAFIGAAIILIIGYVIGDTIGKIVNRIVSQILDKPLEATDIGRTIKNMNINISDLIGGLTKAFIIVVAIVAAVEIMNIGGLTGQLVYQVAIYLPKLIGGITVLTLGLILSIGLARYIGKFLQKAFSNGFEDVAKLVENLILLGLTAVVITIALNILMLQGSLIYPLILGILVIASGIYIAGVAAKILAKVHPAYKYTVPLIETLIILSFSIIGIAGIFAEYAGAIDVIKNISWGIAIAFAALLIPIIFHYTRLAWRTIPEEEDKRNNQ